MSSIAVKGADTGTGVFTIESPATNTDRVLTLPDEAGTILTSGGAIDVDASAPADSVSIDSSGNVDIAQSGGFPGAGNTDIGARIASDGRLFISASGANYAGNFNVNASGEIVRFRNSGVIVGNISVTGSATAYNTSSDYRLKEDWQPVANAITDVKALKPCNFAWKADGTRVNGFLAHELAEVVPEAVHGEKDAVDDEGNPVYQGIDQSKLVPLLTAALQEAIGEIEDLKARVATLEGGA